MSAIGSRKEDSVAVFWKLQEERQMGCPLLPEVQVEALRSSWESPVSLRMGRGGAV